jgi:hypothetical protein
MNVTVGSPVAQLFYQVGRCRRIELSASLDYISKLAVGFQQGVVMPFAVKITNHYLIEFEGQERIRRLLILISSKCY